ncbi:MAG: OmpA family protein [Cognatishimia sp.]|uniref:OmpA family protein n=1 Tax=Cognatishimia sp. TaxID=2211648 RepID=UPI003B8D0223
MKTLSALILGLYMPTASLALELAMPEGSILAFDDIVEQGSYALPDGPYLDDALSTRQINGYVSRQAWHLSGDGVSSEQLIAPLRSQLEAAGYGILLDCDAASCGGFDFRFATDVLPAPDIFVDLVNYRFISAMRETSNGTFAVSVLASRSDVQGYTQLIAVQPGNAADPLEISEANQGAPVVPALQIPADVSDVVKTLQSTGHVVLGDLAFETGSANLAAGAFASLKAISDFLNATPEARISLVGHTDNIGSLEGNIALSEKRANAVRQRLEQDHGIAAERIEARGVGYLSPVASNLTDEGRTANRRVEAVLLAD